MSKTLIGMVTFGNLNFTHLTLESIVTTTKEHNIDLFVIIGKPGDVDTKNYLERSEIPHKVHDKNYGFPYSLNDIYDYAWKENNYDNLIIVGNDIIVYPHCIDRLITLADNSDYLCISALQYDIKSLISEFPETRKYFYGDNLKFLQFGVAEPWKNFKDYEDSGDVADMQLFDIQNCCLYKKELFDIIGYTDVNFYPAYFVDNDYARRIVKSGIKCCSLTSARFFHFWSRTIHQETGGSTGHQFDNNRMYYTKKWGGAFGKETINAPLKIDDRSKELEIIEHWRSS